MKKLLAVALSLMVIGLAPMAATANHCAKKASAEVWSDYGAFYSDYLGRVGCGAGRAEVGDTNYVSPASTFVYMVAFTPAVASETQQPTAGVLKFNNSANKTLIFTWDGDRWSSNHVTIPEGASSVTASACIRPDVYEPCKTISMTYQII
jgi:hypothetical protein